MPLLVQDRDSGMDTWEIVCCGCCSGEETCGYLDPGTIPLIQLRTCVVVVHVLAYCKMQHLTCFGWKMNWPLSKITTCTLWSGSEVD